MARSSTPAPSSTPTTSGWRPAPTPTPPSTRGCRSSSSPSTPRASAGRRCATIAGDITSSTFYDGVRVPGREPGRGREPGVEADHQPAQPRAGGHLPGLGAAPEPRPTCADGPKSRRWATGGRVIDQEWVQLHLARVHAKVEVLKLLNWKVAWAADKGLNPADASATKVYGTELALEVYRLLLRGGGSGRLPARRLARGRAAGPAGASRPESDHLHLRRRDQRGPARHHRHGRPGHAPRSPLSPGPIGRAELRQVLTRLDLLDRR